MGLYLVGVAKIVNENGECSIIRVVDNTYKVNITRSNRNGKQIQSVQFHSSNVFKTKILAPRVIDNL